MTSVQYEQLSTADPVEANPGALAVDPNSATSSSDVRVRNDVPFPISRPPTSYRDWWYAIAFVLHFVIIISVSFAEQKSLEHSMLNYGRAGSWASILMIITLLGSFVGSMITLAIGYSDRREFLLSMGISFSLILKICLGNLLLIMRSRYSFIGLLVLVSAIMDSFKYKAARESVSFVSALMQMVMKATAEYGLALGIACSSIIFLQTCVLLWWGAFFVGAISTISAGYAEALVVLMIFSLYWITQFFHSLMAFIVGGCILWIYAVDDKDELEATKHVLLYSRCACTTSLGSLCRSALYVFPSQLIMATNKWVRSRPRSAATCCSLRGMAALLSDPFVPASVRNHRLAICQLAVYGRTFRRTAEDYAALYPETLAIAMEDHTFFVLQCAAAAVAGLMAIVFGVLAERRDSASLPLFFFVCYYLSYCGISLAIHIYSAAVDAFVVSYALNPVRFAKDNQFVFLRFLRTAEDSQQ